MCHKFYSVLSEELTGFSLHFLFISFQVLCLQKICMFYFTNNFLNYSDICTFLFNVISVVMKFWHFKLLSLGFFAKWYSNIVKFNSCFCLHLECQQMQFIGFVDHIRQLQNSEIVCTVQHICQPIDGDK